MTDPVCPQPPDMDDCKTKKKRCLSGPCVGYAYTEGEECPPGADWDPDACTCTPMELMQWYVVWDDRPRPVEDDGTGNPGWCSYTDNNIVQKDFGTAIECIDCAIFPGRAYPAEDCAFNNNLNGVACMCTEDGETYFSRSGQTGGFGAPRYIAQFAAYANTLGEPFYPELLTPRYLSDYGDATGETGLESPPATDPPPWT